ncbi:glycosyltransferase family 4 protein [Vibrio chagasii]|uniref:glycosyltransferase family 4 protein n=1 Tax=Vibrio chagasii TaxID=170679 RepID=UPI0040697FC7
MQPKKVLHVITGLNNGGAEGVLTNLCINDKSNIHTVVSFLGEGKHGETLRKHNIKLYAFDLSRGEFSFKYLYKLINIIRSERPDVIQTWMYHADIVGGVVSKLIGFKNIYWGVRQSNLSPSVNSFKTLLVIRVCSVLSRFIPKKTIYCAEAAMSSHINFGYKGNFEVIKNGYDIGMFKPDPDSYIEVRKELNIDRDEKLIGFVARWDPQKDHVNLLQSMSYLVKSGLNVKCLLVGENCDENNECLKQLVHKFQLTDNIILLGRRNDINAIMNALDIHVLSSCGEAFPNVVAESMAAGTPCVVTDVGDASDIVGDTGWVVPAQNSELLSDAIEIALTEKRTNPTQWEQRRLQCRSRIVSHFSLQKMIELFQDTWFLNFKN